MGKFDGVLICTDCDGTLTNSKGELSKENAEAIKYFQAEGGRFTLATGRFPEHVYKFSGLLKVNAPVISLNGVLLYDLEKKEKISYSPMETRECEEVLVYLNECWKGIWEYWLNFSGETSGCYKPLEDKFESETLKPEKAVEEQLKMTSEEVNDRPGFLGMLQSIPKNIAKIVFVMPEEMLRPVQKDLREKFGDRFNFDSSWANGLEMQWIKSSKGMAVEELKKYFGDIRKTVCIGDYDNDISMLQMADIGIAVENAIPEVKEVADRVTVSNDDNAIARVIYEMEKETEFMNMIFATGNQGKVREVKMMLEDANIKLDLMTLKEAGIEADIIENGTTFEENAVIKAKTIMEMTGKIAIADDSGLEVDYLDKAPGIYSARFLGEETPYSVKNKYIIDKLKGVEGEDRSARFVCAIAVAFPNGEILTTKGTIEGLITTEERGMNGFGYDPIVYVPEYGMTTGEMDPHLKNSISHRGKALKSMMELLKERL